MTLAVAFRGRIVHLNFVTVASWPFSHQITRTKTFSTFFPHRVLKFNFWRHLTFILIVWSRQVKSSTHFGKIKTLKTWYFNLGVLSNEEDVVVGQTSWHQRRCLTVPSHKDRSPTKKTVILRNFCIIEKFRPFCKSSPKFFARYISSLDHLI